MKFILTKELGRLARWLRILGFDTVYFRQDNKASVLLSALREQRIIITRNRVLFDKVSVKALYLEEEDLEEQLRKVKEGLALRIDKDRLFTRCVICNELLSDVEKETIESKIPEYVSKTQTKFRQCLSCQRVYWPGSHCGNIKKTLQDTGVL